MNCNNHPCWSASPSLPRSEWDGAESPSDGFPEWVPERGHTLRRTGVYFDAVRVDGRLAAVTAARLVAACAGPAGAIVCDNASWQLHFLIPPGHADRRPWPPTTQAHGKRDRSVSYVGIPALEGRTWPLAWCSPPTRDRALVDPELLYDVLCLLTGWRPAAAKPDQ